MSDYMPVEVILEILQRLPVKALVRCRSVCKSWNSIICDPSFILTHLQASLAINTPFLLLECRKRGRLEYSLHYDSDGFGKFKKLPFPPPFAQVVGSCNGVICVHLYPYDGDELRFLLWNPSIEKYISLPQPSFSDVEDLNVGFGFDSRTNDYKLLILGFDKDGYRKRNNGEYSHTILGFGLSVEEFFEINFPESLSGLGPFNISIMEYRESFIAVATHRIAAVFQELWVMKEYGVVESWTKVLTLHTGPQYAWIPEVLGFRKNGEVLLHMGNAKMAALDLNSQQMEAPLYLNSQQIELHAVDVGADLLSVRTYVNESDFNHPIDSSDYDESSEEESDLA
ncbi:hypothetical protein GQ457_02G032080 [Hibiscus cannabinus]